MFVHAKSHSIVVALKKSCRASLVSADKAEHSMMEEVKSRRLGMISAIIAN
jgi:hypothetical protein